MTGNTITVNASALSATGGAGGYGAGYSSGESSYFSGGVGGRGGAAEVRLVSGTGGITVNGGSTVGALGGAGGNGNSYMGNGGDGYVELYSSNGPVSITGASSIAAQGGAGYYQGYAEVKIESGFSGSTPVTITGSTISADGAEGGSVSNDGALVDIRGASVSITGSTITASSAGSESGSDGKIEIYGASGVVSDSSSLNALAYGGDARIYVNSDSTINLTAGALSATSTFNNASVEILAATSVTSTANLSATAYSEAKVILAANSIAVNSGLLSATTTGNSFATADVRLSANSGSVSNAAGITATNSGGFGYAQVIIEGTTTATNTGTISVNSPDGGEGGYFGMSGTNGVVNSGAIGVQATNTSATLLISASSGNIDNTNTLTANSAYGGSAAIGLLAGGSITNSSNIQATSSSPSSAIVGLKAGGDITLTGGTISAIDTGGGPSLVGLLAGNNVTLGGSITTSGQAGADNWLENYSGFIPPEIIALDPNFSGIAALAGNKIVGGAGILSATYPGQAIALQAANGIGSIGTTPVPVRILDGSEAYGADIFLNNTTSGDIAVSFVTNGIQLVGDLDGVYNANPTGAYFIQTEAAGGHIELGIPFQPSGQPLLAGQSVIFQANQADVLFNAGGSTSTSGVGVTTAIGQNVLVNGGAIDGTFNAVATTGNVTQTGGAINGLVNANSLSGNVSLSQGGGYILGLIEAPNGTVTVNTGGSIVDGNSGLNIVASAATLSASGNIGTLADPLETRVGSISLSATYGGEIGIINDGDLVLSSLNFAGTSAAIYASTQLGAGSGTLSLGGPVNVSGNLSLLAGTGMALSTSVSASGALVLDAGGGNLDITPGGGSTQINGSTVFLLGADVNLGHASQSANLDIVGDNGLGIIATGNLNVQGGNGGYTFVRSNGGNLAISTVGNVTVNGGSSGGFAHVLGYPDVVMSVGGTVSINATDETAPARIESALPSTIHLDFTNVTGGFSVNGVEGAIVDPAFNTGFYADGSPAVLGQNLIVTYGGVPVAIGDGIPSIEQAIAQVIASTNENAVINEDDKQPENTDTGPITDGKEKKELPVCK